MSKHSIRSPNRRAPPRAVTLAVLLLASAGSPAADWEEIAPGDSRIVSVMPELAGAATVRAERAREPAMSILEVKTWHESGYGPPFAMLIAQDDFCWGIRKRRWCPFRISLEHPF